MNRRSRSKAVAALLMAVTLTGCSANQDLKTQLRAGSELGRLQAGVTIERQPDECAGPIPHIVVREGQELRSTLKRERAQLDVANARLRDCFSFNEDIRRRLEGAK